MVHPKRKLFKSSFCHFLKRNYGHLKKSLSNLPKSSFQDEQCADNKAHHQNPGSHFHFKVVVLECIDAI